MDVWLFSIASRVIVYSELQDYTAASRVLQSFHVLDEQALFSAVPLFLGGVMFWMSKQSFLDYFISRFLLLTYIGIQPGLLWIEVIHHIIFGFI